MIGLIAHGTRSYNKNRQDKRAILSRRIIGIDKLSKLSRTTKVLYKSRLLPIR
jgi:hypothetical protein